MLDDSVIELSSFGSAASRHTTVANEESSSDERTESDRADQADGGRIGGNAGRLSQAESSSAASVVDLNSLSDGAGHDDDFSSSSSSSSSGVPGQQMRPIGTRAKKPGDGVSQGPPEVININSPACQENKMRSTNVKPAKKKSLTNENKTIAENSSCTDSSTLDSRASSGQGKITAKAKPRKKRRQWGRKKAPDDSSHTSSKSIADGGGPRKKASPDQESKHYHCYLLRSLDPGHPLKTYIGFTTDPERRLRQHNGDLKNGGARRTKRAGRPWTFVCVVHG